MHACTYRHTPITQYTQTDRQINAYIQRDECTLTHKTHTHTHTYTRAHTHTRTHILCMHIHRDVTCYGNVCACLCLSACLSACLPVCLSACLSVCLPARLFVCPFDCFRYIEVQVLNYTAYYVFTTSAKPNKNILSYNNIQNNIYIYIYIYKTINNLFY